MMSTSFKKKDVAKWSNMNRKVLIDLLTKHSAGRFANLSNDKTAWQIIAEEFKIRTGLEYNKEMLKTQCFSLKKKYLEFTKYANQSGFGMDASGMVTGAPEALNEYYASHPKAAEFADGPLMFFNELTALFGRK